MRVHLRNVVHSAIERGLVVGHHRVDKLAKRQQKDMDMVVNVMVNSVWESLDKIIDFRDDEDETQESSTRSRIGFHSVDAVAVTSLPVEDETKDENDDGIVPLDVLHRIDHKISRSK